MKDKRIMFQGTSSNVGKSILAAAFCRILKQDGYKVAPFKSQNMALNSFVTKDGGEIGRAQGVQAEAAGVEATIDMNPVLLKPKKDSVAQVIVHGQPVADLTVKDYIKYKPKALEAIKQSLDKLERDYDVIVIEGAGSPVEMNLKAHDIANMKVAELADSPVVLIADIDRGGVMASLVGTVSLLDPEERDRVKGLIINKFRGDISILKPALDFLEEKTGKPVLGVIPYMHKMNIEEEDSVVMNEELLKNNNILEGNLDVVVIHLPHISNFTDFDALDMEPCVNLRYVNKLNQLGCPDLIILPGTKNTVDDLIYLFKSGFAQKIRDLSSQGVPVIGICGGYQILGKKLYDPEHVESDLDVVDGLGLLPLESTFAAEKITKQVTGKIIASSFFSREGQEIAVNGYEIHMGRTDLLSGAKNLIALKRDEEDVLDGAVSADGLTVGSYVHGFFDNDALRQEIIKYLAEKKGLQLDGVQELRTKKAMKEEAYNNLADLVRNNVNMDLFYKIMNMD